MHYSNLVSYVIIKSINIYILHTLSNTPLFIDYLPVKHNIIKQIQNLYTYIVDWQQKLSHESINHKTFLS